MDLFLRKSQMILLQMYFLIIYNSFKAVKLFFLGGTMRERIMRLPLIRWITGWRLCQWAAGHPLLSRFCNYEVISYIICGVVTTIVNYVSYFASRGLGVSVLLSQCIAWTIAVFFAFAVNKAFVFDSPDWSKSTLIREIIPFFSCRIASFLLETVFMEVTVSILHWNEPLMKIIANVFVLIINYVGSKLLVFRKNPKERQG